MKKIILFSIFFIIANVVNAQSFYKSNIKINGTYETITYRCKYCGKKITIKWLMEVEKDYRICEVLKNPKNVSDDRERYLNSYILSLTWDCYYNWCKLNAFFNEDCSGEENNTSNHSHDKYNTKYESFSETVSPSGLEAFIEYCEQTGELIDKPSYNNLRALSATTTLTIITQSCK